MLTLQADFETTTDPTDLRVWAWCLVDVDTLKVVGRGIDIDSFFKYLEKLNCHVYFHNLKFDGEFILWKLLSEGWVRNDTKTARTFDTLISDQNQWYNVTQVFSKNKNKYCKTTYYDSLKKLPFSVAQIAKAFKLDIAKGSIDYGKYRPVGYEPDDNEWDYIEKDCLIVAEALRIQMRDNNLTRMTVGSDALNSFKEIIGKNRYKDWFPVLDLDTDKDSRMAYKGGVVQYNKKYAGEIVHGKSYDVNSLYPFAMYDTLLPYGYPMYYEGQYKEDKFFPLYIQQIDVMFDLKEGHMPTIQLKGNSRFADTEYIESSGDEIVTLTLTSVDLEMFFEHYNVTYIEYRCGYMFKGTRGIFKS